ncbi:type II toxin-antitoxin system HigB family toxin [Pontibacter harenae]|uniref:type II toxin-antitoxin system HigB family toxin n=1 Tax=Pontibacter harenae TaxID=2894083 RepID=UPI001E45664A|nr:type II toxin-antitoxin system HigB family toxin [Pontibacter harenae]MCC9166364.1 type II toxin-antitoxin system HigB family toxin [Pontibacter harenae]
MIQKISGMNIVTVSRIKKFFLKHADSKLSLEVWVARVSALRITNLNDLKQVANSVDVIGNNRVIFDIKGNKYRIITVVLVRNQTVYIRWIGTHAEYDKIDAHTV